MTWAGVLRERRSPDDRRRRRRLLTPVRAWFGPDSSSSTPAPPSRRFAADNSAQDGSRLHARLSDLNVARQEAVSPVERLQHALHGWVAFAIMPLFALANAGVTLRGRAPQTAAGPQCLLGVSVGLVVGKPIGVIVFLLARRARRGRGACRPACGWSASWWWAWSPASASRWRCSSRRSLSRRTADRGRQARHPAGVARRRRDRIDRGPTAASVHGAPRGRADTGRGGALDDRLTRGSAVAQAIEVVAEVDLLDDVDDQFLEALGGRPSASPTARRWASSAKSISPSAACTAAISSSRPLLQRGRVGGERLGRGAAIEALRVELVDVEGEVHRQAGHLQDAAAAGSSPRPSPRRPAGCRRGRPPSAGRRRAAGGLSSSWRPRVLRRRGPRCQVRAGHSSQSREPAMTGAMSMTRALMAALLLAIPLVTAWILGRRVPHPVKSRR